MPNSRLRRFNTKHYQRYDPRLNNNVGALVTTPFTKFDTYDDYTLYMNPFVDSMKRIPTAGVRVDDMTVAFILLDSTPTSRFTLHYRWPVDFDQNGMVRATRVPLGHAKKVWCEEGTRDMDGIPVPPGGRGWYYVWYARIHCLMGKEGLDHDLYYVRPSWEDLGLPMFGFKVAGKAVVQLPSGHPNDPTF